MNNEYTKRIGFYNGKFIPVGNLQIPIDNLAVNRGYAAFDFFGVYHGKPFFGDRYIDRFFNTIEILKLKIAFSKEEVTEVIQKIIDINEIENLFLKLFALPTELNHTNASLSSLAIFPVDAPLYEDSLYEKGGSLISKPYTRFLPKAKSTNYLPMVYWLDEMEQKGVVDVLYHTNDIVRETSRGNIFMVKNGIFTTPEEDIIYGITRSIVLEFLKKDNAKVEKSNFTLVDLLEADEVFLTSTTKKIMPIVKIDGKKIGVGVPSPYTIKLMQDFMLLQDSW